MQGVIVQMCEHNVVFCSLLVLSSSRGVVMYLGRDAAMNPERPAAATLTVCGGGDKGGAVNSELVVRWDYTSLVPGVKWYLVVSSN